MRIEISREAELLDTGGGLKKAAWFFLEEPDAPFLVHNVDVLSAIDLNRMVEVHKRDGALATLAVQKRATARPLLFDPQGRLRGRGVGVEAGAEPLGPTSGVESLAFAGIHVLSPRIFGLLQEDGPFSIIDAYIRLAAQGEKISAFRADGAYWRDLGRPANIAQAAADMTNGVYVL